MSKELVKEKEVKILNEDKKGESMEETTVDWDQEDSVS